jgi:hypothetical protein
MILRMASPSVRANVPLDGDPSFILVEGASGTQADQVAEVRGFKASAARGEGKQQKGGL